MLMKKKKKKKIYIFQCNSQVKIIPDLGNVLDLFLRIRVKRLGTFWHQVTTTSIIFIFHECFFPLEKGRNTAIFGSTDFFSAVGPCRVMREQKKTTVSTQKRQRFQKNCRLRHRTRLRVRTTITDQTYGTEEVYIYSNYLRTHLLYLWSL